MDINQVFKQRAFLFQTWHREHWKGGKYAIKYPIGINKMQTYLDSFWTIT
jgi:hypothetical protein